MSQSVRIELNVGPDRAYRVAVGLIWLLVLVNIGSHAETVAWPWLSAALLLLALLHPFLQGRSSLFGRVQIFRDGTVITSVSRGTWKGQGWASPWATILRLEVPIGRRTSRVLHVLVCASRNSANDYRRLLVWNRYPPARACSIAAGSGLE